MDGPTIARIEAIGLEAPLDEPFGYAQAWVDARTTTLVRVEASDGTVGWGECWGPVAGTRETVEEFLAPRLEGESPFAVPRHYDDLYDACRAAYQSVVPLPALSGVEIALRDLVGKLRDRSVAAMLGGRRRESVRAYATGHYFRPVDTVEEQYERITEEALGNAEALGAVKLKVGLAIDGYGPAEDVELVRRVREAVGPDVTLMVDANYAYDRPTAERVGRAIADLDVRWFEEPVRPEDLDGYAALRRALPMAVAGGECHTPAEFERLLAADALDVVQPDVCNVGGLTPARRVADRAAADRRATVVPHVWGTPVALAASLQFLATLRTDSWLEFDRSPNPLREELAPDSISPGADGQVPVPEGPGLGIELDRDAVERYRVD